MSQEVGKWFVNGLEPTYYMGYIGVATHLLTISVLSCWDIQVPSLGQTKTIFTAAFMWQLMGRKFTMTQLTALLMLVAGGV